MSHYHTALRRFSMLDISRVGIVPGAKNAGVGIMSRRAFRRRMARSWHPLGRRAIELGQPPQGGGDNCDLRRRMRYGTAQP